MWFNGMESSIMKNTKKHSGAKTDVESTYNSLATWMMILTQLNNTFACTLHSHLAPRYCSLHLPSPFTSPLQNHLIKKYAVAHLLPSLGSHHWHLQILRLASLSSLRWSCYFSETEMQEENQRWVQLPHLPAPLASCPWALTLVASLAAKCSRAEIEHSWDMHDDWL